jgi:hypothetical protein
MHFRITLCALLATVLAPGLAGADHASCGDPAVEHHLLGGSLFLWVVRAEGGDCFGAALTKPEPALVECDPDFWVHQDAGPATVAVCPTPGEPAYLGGVWFNQCEEPQVCPQGP